MRTDHIISLVSRIRDKANQLILDELRRRDIRGLAPSHGDILNVLYQSQGTSMMEIADRIGRNKATVTSLVGKLKDFGYVQTRKDPEDGRVTRVALSNKGWGLKQDFEEISQLLIQRVYEGFNEQEKEVIVHGLEKIRENL